MRRRSFFLNGEMNGAAAGFAVLLPKNACLNGGMNGTAAGFAVHLA